MVTSNQLRLQLFSVLHGEVFSSQTIFLLQEKLSEEELGALVVMFTDISQNLNIQDRRDDCEWLVDVAKKYYQFLLSLNVNSIVRGTYIEILDNVLRYLNFRRENSDVGCKEIFDAVHEYVRMLRCKCDMPEISVTEQERQMLTAILGSFEPELNKLVMALLCCFSFDKKHISLVENFLMQRRDLVLNYVRIIGKKKCNFIF